MIATPTTLRKSVANRPSSQPTATTVVPLGASLDRLTLATQPQAKHSYRPEGGVFGWLGNLLRGLFGGNGGYNPWQPAPVDNGGYVPPETSYGVEIGSLLDAYDRRQAELGYRKDHGMPNAVYARQERDLWHQTCERIVRSWAPRDQKLAALGHVLNSSTMYYSDFEQYANRIGGVSQPYPGYPYGSNEPPYPRY